MDMGQRSALLLCEIHLNPLGPSRPVEYPSVQSRVAGEYLPYHVIAFADAYGARNFVRNSPYYRFVVLAPAWHHLS